MAYQDRWIRGSVTPGDRSCAERYELIAPLVGSFARPVTVWDLGANLGYFGCRLAEEYGAVSIMVDQRPALVDVCRQNALPTTVAMTTRLTVRDLQELAASEHADIVLALNVLHHFDDPVAAFRAVCALGETIVIETPGRGDTGAVHYGASQVLLGAIESSAATLLGTTDSHVTRGVKRPVYKIDAPKSCVIRGYAYGDRVRARGAHPARPHVITSTAKEKTIAFADGESRPWVPGMNLWNWLQFGGSDPERLMVRNAVERAAFNLREPHGDLRPWNVILQGRHAVIIDRGHRQSVPDSQGLQETLDLIEHPEHAYVA